MKQSEIKAGKKYRGGSGSIREIMKIGTARQILGEGYNSRAMGIFDKLVHYRKWDQFQTTPQHKHCRLPSFVSWAREEAK